VSVNYSAAGGSNAGNSVHELWALRQALALLTPATQLSAVTVDVSRVTQ
jgi:hypothetical protein